MGVSKERIGNLGRGQSGARSGDEGFRMWVLGFRAWGLGSRV